MLTETGLYKAPPVLLQILHRNFSRALSYSFIKILYDEIQTISVQVEEENLH